MRVQNAGRKKGTPKTGGRQKGVRNHVTTSLRDAIIHAFDTVGGEAYLVRVARSNPTVFCTLLARILPLQLSAAAAREGASSPASRIAETLDLLRNRLGPAQLQYFAEVERGREQEQLATPLEGRGSRKPRKNVSALRAGDQP
jgi:hypothetical protein